MSTLEAKAHALRNATTNHQSHESDIYAERKLSRDKSLTKSKWHNDWSSRSTTHEEG